MKQTMGEDWHIGEETVHYGGQDLRFGWRAYFEGDSVGLTKDELAARIQLLRQDGQDVPRSFEEALAALEEQRS